MLPGQRGGGSRQSSDEGFTSGGSPVGNLPQSSSTAPLLVSSSSVAAHAQKAKRLSLSPGTCNSALFQFPRQVTPSSPPSSQNPPSSKMEELSLRPPAFTACVLSRLKYDTTEERREKTERTDSHSQEHDNWTFGQVTEVTVAEARQEGESQSAVAFPVASGSACVLEKLDRRQIYIIIPFIRVSHAPPCQACPQERGRGASAASSRK